MDHDQFWQIIEQAKAASGGDDDQQVTLIGKALARLTAQDIVDFDVILDEYRQRAYRRDLWAAAYIINGGCSDDGFVYFGGWLIGQGRDVFEAALADPETLKDHLCKGLYWEAENERLLHVAWWAYKKKMGQEMPDRPRLAWELTGPEWDDDTVDEMFPELSQAVKANYEDGG